jgi:hypothetical protein
VKFSAPVTVPVPRSGVPTDGVPATGGRLATSGEIVTVTDTVEVAVPSLAVTLNVAVSVPGVWAAALRAAVVGV